MPVLAQEGDVNEQGSCREEGSEEYLWWPAVKIRLSHFLKPHFKKIEKKKIQLSGVLKI